MMLDHSIVNWIHTTISKSVFNIVFKSRSSAFTLWTDIEGIFRDNELERAVYLEAKFRNLQQGDMSMTEYTTRLKTLADNLRNVGHTVSEPSQVLNLLRGLNPKYRHVKPVMKARRPPHTFMSAWSFLLLEEASADHEDKQAAGHALYAGHSSTSNDGNSSSGGSHNKPRNKKHGSGRPSHVGGGAGGSAASGTPPGFGSPWATGYNPWTGFVQAWPMPVHAPRAGVLGTRPQAPSQQAMTAHHQLSLPGPPAASSSTWDTTALMAALQNAVARAQYDPTPVVKMPIGALDGAFTKVGSGGWTCVPQ
ncbi:hypothetical protein QOZ80_5AG0391610 [Eleusine coracana subsp. coracana]|nr:hypothetical protein QOZ80_5AG0391610 [Eleusine coracana subsp. coracana]